MARSYSLAAYQLRVREERKDDWSDLNNFGKNYDFLTVLREFLETVGKAADHDQQQQKVLRARNVEQVDRMLEGILESGDYGAETPVYDTETKSDCYTIKRGQAPLKRFYFRADLAEQEKRGLLLLQREGQLGIQDAFFRAFRAYFRQACPNVYLEAEPLAPEEMLKHYQQPKRVKKISFILNRVPKNFFGRWDNGLQEVEGYLEVTFHAKVNGSLPWATGYRESVIDGDVAKRMLTIPGLDEPDEVKVLLDVGNGDRTINVTNPRMIRASFDITNQVQPSHVDGHLPFEDLRLAAAEVARRIATRLRMVITDVQQDQSDGDLE